MRGGLWEEEVPRLDLGGGAVPDQEERQGGEQGGKQGCCVWHRGGRAALQRLIEDGGDGVQVHGHWGGGRLSLSVHRGEPWSEEGRLVP